MEGHFMGHSNVHHQPHPLPTIKIFCEAEKKCSLAIRDGQVVLASSNPNDPLQHWIKDMRYSTRIKDEEGFPSFVLINKATGQAIKHSFGKSHPLHLIPFNSHYLDESVLWTESSDVGDGFRCIRMINNKKFVFDADIDGAQGNVQVHDGTKIILWDCWNGPNQRWQIMPYGDELVPKQFYIPLGIYTYPGANTGYCGPFGQTIKIYCEGMKNCNLTIRNDKVVLQLANPRDPYQHWKMDTRYSTGIKDEEGNPAFALVNRGTGQALKHSLGENHPVRLIPFNPGYLDESVLWTHKWDYRKYFTSIRMVNNINLNFDAALNNNKELHVGTHLILYKFWEADNQLWAIDDWK